MATRAARAARRRAPAVGAIASGATLLNNFARAVGYDLVWEMLEAAQAEVEGAAAAEADAAEASGRPARGGRRRAAALLAAADAASAARAADAWHALLHRLMTRLHDGYAMDVEAPTLGVTKLFYPQWWLEKVGYYGPRYYPCYGGACGGEGAGDEPGAVDPNPNVPPLPQLKHHLVAGGSGGRGSASASSSPAATGLKGELWRVDLDAAAAAAADRQQRQVAQAQQQLQALLVQAAAADATATTAAVATEPPAAAEPGLLGAVWGVAIFCAGLLVGALAGHGAGVARFGAAVGARWRAAPLPAAHGEGWPSAVAYVAFTDAASPGRSCS